MKPAQKILKYFLIWRILLFTPVILGGYFLEYGNSFPFFEITHYKPLPEFLNHPVLTAWSNFDGVHYLNIAADGYMSGARFFPGLPLLTAALSLGNISFPLTYLISLLIPAAAFPAALILFYKLLRLDYPEKISFNALTFLLVFPTSFFFAAVYTESLFLLLSLSCFYFAAKRNWLAAALTGLLLTSTRFVGIFIIPALIYEYWIREKPLRLKDFFILSALSLTSALGLIGYSLYNFFKWGNPTYFLSAHTELNNGRTANSLVLPIQTLYRYFKILTSLSVSQFEWWIALLEVSAFIFGCLMLFIAWKKKVRLTYLIFAAGTFLLPAFSGTFTGMPRYLLVMFPIFIALSLIKSNSVKITYTLISILLSALLLMFFTRGYYVA